ncbi:glycosyl transferase [Thalassobacillus devorans]|uniref:Glycosyl transferase n=1 Tax=Thalassobacillus devorans TaxID=279813 RepID=A0ABQ1P1F9_9BACI|nr:glycosyltransferase family 2 protein [Thalassobacillus devorans]NIK28604.1 cellulose synthase/poly-beta-1,6-N-acetylglucosamine synthase-like glycosyltransferase [Thalassobacillus devorans]GGC84941.1 glycosyl transferase [Thalassobacillus devorans]
MTSIVIVLFWISFLLLAYSYFLYPLFMILISKTKSKGIKKDYNFKGKISFIIPAYNEEEVIKEKIDNTIEVLRGFEDSEILIGSDGSNDRTNEIINGYKEHPQFIVKAFSERRGKISVLNDLYALSSGEILIFTDASSIVEKDAIKHMVSNFSVDKIGGVGAVKTNSKIKNKNNVKNQEGFYWKMEEFTKRGESRFGKLVGADGPLFAIRKELYEKLPAATILDDFCITMKVASQSYFVYEDKAIVFEYPSKNYREEFKRRVRLSTGAYQSMSILSKEILSLNLLSFFFFSHKIIRWISPFLMFITLITNIFLGLKSGLYTITLSLQIVIYTFTLMAHLSENFKKNKIISFIYYFIISNLIQIIGFVRALRRSSGVLWDKAQK